MAILCISWSVVCARAYELVNKTERKSLLVRTAFMLSSLGPPMGCSVELKWAQNCECVKCN